MKKCFLIFIVSIVGAAILYSMFTSHVGNMIQPPTHLTPALIYDRFTPLTTDKQGRRYGWLNIPEWNDSVYVRITPHQRGLSLAYLTPPDYTITQNGTSYTVGQHYFNSNDWLYYWKSKQAVMESPDKPIVVPYVEDFPLPPGYGFGWKSTSKDYVWDPIFSDERLEFGGPDRVILDQPVPRSAIDADKVALWLKKYPGPEHSTDELNVLRSYIPLLYTSYLDAWIDDNARAKGISKEVQWNFIFNQIVTWPRYYNDLYRLLGKLDNLT